MADAAKQEPVITMWSKEFTYDRWMKIEGYSDSHGVTLLKILRTVELEWWEERGCKAAFIQLLGPRGRQRRAGDGNSSGQIACRR